MPSQNLDFNASDVRTAFPAAARLFDTLTACCAVASTRALATRCEAEIQALPGLPALDRYAVLTLCHRYGDLNGGSEFANTIINDIAYRSWAELRDTYRLPGMPSGEEPSEFSWPLRVMLLHLIVEEARQLVLEDTVTRLAVISDGDTTAAATALNALSVEWGNPPTPAEIEAAFPAGGN